MKEIVAKVKAFFSDLAEKYGWAWVIAVAACAVAALIHPVLAIVVAGVFVAYKTGALDKVIAKFKKD